MKTAEKWKIYKDWVDNNRCFNTKCLSCSYYICEDIRGIKDCKTYIPYIAQDINISDKEDV